MTDPIFLSSQSSAVSWPPDPIANPRAWDKVRIAGVESPGLARVGEFKRRWIWDEKKGKGQPRATLTFTGAYLARGKIRFELQTGPDGHGGTFIDLAKWVQFAALFQYDPTKTIATAVDIDHPSLAVAKLKSFVCEGITNPRAVYEGDSLYFVEVELIEWAPAQAVNVASTVTKTKAIPPNTTNPPGAQPLDSDVAQRQAIIAELQKKLAAP